MAKKTWSLKKALLKNKETLASVFKCKRRGDSQPSILDGVVFKVMYVVEAVVLISTVCFFFLCCGCHF